MSNHPTIAALRAALESERKIEAEWQENHVWRVSSYKDITHARSYSSGHEAATERLLGLLEKAIEVLENLQGHADASLLFPHKDRIDLFKAEQKAREFLTTLADASGDINEENK